MNMKPSRFSEMAIAATLKFLQEEVMVRLKGERVLGKKAMQQREGKKSKLDHFLRNQDQPKEIKEHESFPSESRRAKRELESIDQGARELGV
jgi:hypothetical protein